MKAEKNGKTKVFNVTCDDDILPMTTIEIVEYLQTMNSLE